MEQHKTILLNPRVCTKGDNLGGIVASNNAKDAMLGKKEFDSLEGLVN